jgi:hypothetical protein
MLQPLKFTICNYSSTYIVINLPTSRPGLNYMSGYTSGVSQNNELDIFHSTYQAKVY